MTRFPADFFPRGDAPASPRRSPNAPASAHSPKKRTRTRAPGLEFRQWTSGMREKPVPAGTVKFHTNHPIFGVIAPIAPTSPLPPVVQPGGWQESQAIFFPSPHRRLAPGNRTSVNIPLVVGSLLAGRDYIIIPAGMSIFSSRQCSGIAAHGRPDPHSASGPAERGGNPSSPELSNFTQFPRFLASSRRLRQLCRFAPGGDSVPD